VKSLDACVALVTGASRGVGRGIALALGAAGATVYVTGRTTDGDPPGELPGTIDATARDVSAAGGRGVALRCDHRDDTQVEAVFARIAADHGRLDLLVNNVWGGYERMVEDGVYRFADPFWRQPISRWDSMFAAGVRAHYVASALGAALMVPRGRGLIVNISFFAAQKYLSNVAYGVSKAATDRLTRDCAHELRAHGVAVVSLYPGLVRTESVMRAAEYLDLSNSESAEFVGRAVAALAADPDVLRRSGEVLIAAALAREYGFTDLDGNTPRPLSVAEV
jgi:NAD(P)-dependent dehydrogenase (short-subunit alcohol dehydrogenase family)